MDALLTALTKIPEREGSVSPSTICGQTARLLATLVSLIYLINEFFLFPV